MLKGREGVVGGFAFGSATTLALKVDVGSDGSTLSENRREQGKFPYQIVASSSCARAVVPSNVKS